MTNLAEGADLVLAYGTHLAVSKSSFAVPAGALTAVIGPNGSGKSTLLHAIAGLIEPLSGTLTILGQPLRGVSRQIAYVMQSMSVPEGAPITVREVVAMGRYPSVGWLGRFRRTDHEQVAAAMQKLDVTDLAARHLTELSGGQRQRVFVAQGIAQDHDALLLDEPLTGLDLVSARAIDELIHSEQRQGRSVVLTTHDLDEARAADHVILMNRRVVASGPPETVLTPENLKTAYGLGVLHATTGQVLDDPSAVAHQDHQPKP